MPSIRSVVNPVWGVAIILFATTTLGLAREPAITGGRLVDYGIYEVKRSGELIDAFDTTAGAVYAASSIRLLSTTNVIVAKPKTSFGISYAVEGAPNGAFVRIVVQRIHPTIRSPLKGVPTVIDRYETFVRIGDVAKTTFTFDHPWEMVSGRWICQILAGKSVIVQKTFDVKVPK